MTFGVSAAVRCGRTLYDVVDPALQDQLYGASPYNVIRLELNRDEAGDGGMQDRYKRAARFLKDWLREGILRQDEHRALMFTTRELLVDGRGTTCVRGSSRACSTRADWPREDLPPRTDACRPGADRLVFDDATGFNLSPVFGLYPDATEEVHRKIEAGLRDRTPLVATDHLGVENRLWIVTDQETHTVVSGLMAAKPVFIADGHHRYETALKYRDQIVASGHSSGHDDPSQFCLMMLVGMSDPGLLILPTHRLISGYPGLTADVLQARLESQFEVQLAGTGETGCRAAWDAIEHNAEQDLLGFGTVADGQWLLARLRSDSAMDRLAANRAADCRSLGVSALHVSVLKELLGDLGTASCRYVH